MTILAYKHDDAISLIKSFDETHQVQDDQIVDIVLDLDSWDQEADGVIELQGSGYDTKAKLSEIIHQRTGLAYSQAPKFYDKIEQAFLDRRIPLLPGEAAATQGDAAGLSGVGMTGLVGSVSAATKTQGSTPNLLHQLDDKMNVGGVMAQIQANIRKLEPAPGKLPSLQAGKQIADLRKLEGALGELTTAMDRTRSLLKDFGDHPTGPALNHPALEAERRIFGQSEKVLQEMLGHYHKKGTARPSDLAIIQRYTRSLYETNTHLASMVRNIHFAAKQAKVVAPQVQQAATVLRAAPQIVSLARAAQGVSSLANGVRTFLAPARALVNQSSAARASLWGAAALAAGGLIFLAVDSAADAGPKAPKEVEFVNPERNTVTLPSEEPHAPAPATTVNIEELPKVPSSRPRRTSAK